MLMVLALLVLIGLVCYRLHKRSYHLESSREPYAVAPLNLPYFTPQKPDPTKPTLLAPPINLSPGDLETNTVQPRSTDSIEVEYKHKQKLLIDTKYSMERLRREYNKLNRPVHIYYDAQADVIYEADLPPEYFEAFGERPGRIYLGIQ